jgi:Protein of unknown function (DUF4038)/Putative collagen-binding domain of a collagenase
MPFTNSSTVRWYRSLAAATTLIFLSGCGSGGGGAGAAPASKPEVTLSVPSVSFPQTFVGASSLAQEVRISNAGSGTLTISSVTITGSDSADFAETNTCGPALAAGADCVMSLTFTPIAAGSRSASVSFADNAGDSPQTVTVSGMAMLATTVAFPLKDSSNRRYLVDQNGVPFLLMADSPQSILGNLPASSMSSYMADRQALGFNGLWVNLLCDTYTACNSNGTAYDNTVPFLTGSDPSSYDLSTPNSAYFVQVDQMLKLAAAHDLVVFLDPIETGGWLGTLEHNGAAKAYNYGVYLGDRYKSFPNIVWLSGNDFQSWSSNPNDNNLVKQVMAGIASVDPNHLQTIELNYQSSYSNQDSTLGSLLTLDSAYSYYETYDMILQSYKSSPSLPTYLVEANYEYENNTGALPGPAGPYALREQAYWTLLSGGAGQVYGNHYTWTFASGWQPHLDSPGASQIQYINKLFKDIPWWSLVPDASHQVVTAGYGAYNGSNQDLNTATYCTTSWDGKSLAITYCPNGTTLTIDLSHFNSEVTVQWYDPSNGTFTPVSGSPFPNSGSSNFESPGRNHDGDADWVLVLQASDLP